MAGKTLEERKGIADPVTLVSRESRRIDRWIDIDDLLKKRSHSTERVPKHGRQVGNDLAFLAQLEQSVLPGLRVRQLDYPGVDLLAVDRRLQGSRTLLGTHIFTLSLSLSRHTRSATFLTYTAILVFFLTLHDACSL